MLAEVEAYFTAKADADRYRDENIAALQAELPTRHTDLEGRIYSIQLEAIEEIREAKKNQAWRDLRDSTNKAVAWIVSKFRNSDYREHCEKVLAILPATLDQLEELRIEEGWCSDFTDYVNQAFDEGALDIAGVEGRRRQFDRWITQHIGYRYLDTTHEMLTGLVKAEVEAAKEAWEAGRALTEQATNEAEQDL